MGNEFKDFEMETPSLTLEPDLGELEKKEEVIPKKQLQKEEVPVLTPEEQQRLENIRHNNHRSRPQQPSNLQKHADEHQDESGNQPHPQQRITLLVVHGRPPFSPGASCNRGRFWAGSAWADPACSGGSGRRNSSEASQPAHR